MSECKYLLIWKSVLPEKSPCLLKQPDGDNFPFGRALTWFWSSSIELEGRSSLKGGFHGSELLLPRNTATEVFCHWFQILIEKIGSGFWSYGYFWLFSLKMFLYFCIQRYIAVELRCLFLKGQVAGRIVKEPVWFHSGMTRGRGGPSILPYVR